MIYNIHEKGEFEWLRVWASDENHAVVLAKEILENDLFNPSVIDDGYLKAVEYVLKFDDEIPDYCDVIEVEDLKGFMNYDGSGHLIKDGMMAGSVFVSPSDFDYLPDDVSEIAWFNK